jgi:hypothetical protein
MTRAINTGPKFGSREQVIAEARAYGTLSRDGCSSPDLFAGGLKLMISRWRSAGIQGSSATAGEQAAQTAYRSKGGMIPDRPVLCSPASMQAPSSTAEVGHDPRDIRKGG